jgi:hypothetical protein
MRRPARAAAGALLVIVAMACGRGSDTPTSPSANIPIWTQQGSGNTVLTKPSFVRRLRINGTFGGTSQNFIVWCGSSLLVNVILGSSTFAAGRTYDGTHVAENCAEVRIEQSNGVAWTLTEVR